MLRKCHIDIHVPKSSIEPENEGEIDGKKKKWSEGGALASGARLRVYPVEIRRMVGELESEAREKMSLFQKTNY